MFPDEEEDDQEMTKPTFEYDPDIDDFEGILWQSNLMIIVFISFLLVFAVDMQTCSMYS